MKNNPAAVAEARDALAVLLKLGFGALLTALQDPACYTAQGRLVASTLARKLRTSRTLAIAQLRRARQSLEEQGLTNSSTRRCSLGFSAGVPTTTSRSVLACA